MKLSSAQHWDWQSKQWGWRVDPIGKENEEGSSNRRAPGPHTSHRALGTAGFLAWPIIKLSNTVRRPGPDVVTPTAEVPALVNLDAVSYVNVPEDTTGLQLQSGHPESGVAADCVEAGDTGQIRFPVQQLMRTGEVNSALEVGSSSICIPIPLQPPLSPQCSVV